MKLKPKINESNNADHLKKKIGFDNKKMLMKRADVEITSTKFSNIYDKQNLVEPIVSEKEPAKSGYHKEIKKTQSSLSVIFLFKNWYLI
jgi:hypothetical protein